MANGFPEPQPRPGFPIRSGAALAAPPSQPPAAKADESAKPTHLFTTRRWFAASVFVALGLGALVAVSSRASRVGSRAVIEPTREAEPRPVRAVRSARSATTQARGAALARQLPGAPSALAEPDDALPAIRGEPTRVPEAYTGDPEGQALWEKTVEEEQQTLQPDDLIVDPPRPPVDLSKVPSLEHLHLDADGNVNE